MTNKHKDKIIQLRAEGKTYNEIQKILGCSKGTISYHVGEGQKEKSATTRNRLRTKIMEYVQEYKENIGCVDCGEKYPYYMLDLDHLKDKKFGINRFKDSTSSLEKVKEEMAKCEVVCANCHRIRTQNRKNRA
jgi:transposase